MADLDTVIRARRSVRGFDPQRPVPDAVLEEALELAQRAPSNCNVQPWRVFIAMGERCQKLRAALTAAVDAGDLGDPEDGEDRFLEDARRLQVECAAELYGQMGVEREDKRARFLAFRRNYELFDAPHVAILCMEKHYGIAVALDVGAYLQTLMLALWARGVASCPQVSLRRFPGLLRRELGIPESARILCGLSFGYEDDRVPANRTRQRREPVSARVTFVR